MSSLKNRLRKPSSAVPVRLKPDATASVVPVASGFSRTVTPPDDIERVLDGRWEGQRFVVERHMPPSSRCGRATIGDLAARLEASAHEAPLICGGVPARQPFVFFDLETTGLSGGAGTQAFLVGSGWFEADGGFTTRQRLLARQGDEQAMLHAVAEDLGRAGALVSFNGKSFDAPVLETRYLFHRLDWIASEQPHIDVLHPARRFWKEDECSLGVLEQQVLGAWREDDVAGSKSRLGTFSSCDRATHARWRASSSTTAAISSRSRV